MINQLTIIGTGLIGGSLALALKKANYCNKIVGLGRNPQRLDAACKAGVIDEGTDDYRQGLANADVVMISTPLSTYATVFENIKPHINETMVLSDAGSAKRCVVEAAKQVFGNIPKCLVPGHPIAGNEKSGFEAASPDLYAQRKVLITPLPETNTTAITTVTEMWQATGACVEQIGVDLHDNILAATSHLPHMLAFGLVDSLAQQNNVDQIFRYAAGGFRDFTRIAASDPVMWRDICLQNREAVLAALDLYEQDLAQVRTAIEQGDADTLQTIFARAKKARDQFTY